MKIVNKTGYLKGAKTAKNPVNIIPSNLITTQGMAFPIKANGKTLYPNTGQYKFPTSPVVETPLKKKNGSKLIKFKNGSKGVSLAFSRGEKDPKGGLTQKGVDKYNRATGGNLKMAVTTPPSKLKAGSKAANRRKSFCARMSGVKGPMAKNGKPTRKALALRKWNC
jgi:hypothetical protein